jgi:acetyltransferase-like isoleucine patch superfamily enzyme
MIGSIVRRLAYLRYLFFPGAWRWYLARLDFLIEDHLKPWRDLRRPRSGMVHPTVSLRHAYNIHLGERTRVQPYCVLWASPNGRIVVGEDTGLGPGTMIFASNHTFVPGTPYHQQPWVEKDVTIGKDVWVGAGCILVAGVRVGDGVVLAAGSVVTKDIPPSCIAGGVPARVLGSRAG